MNNMKKDFEKIFIEKEYSDLTIEELQELNAYNISESDFYQIQTLFSEMKSISDFKSEVQSELKDDLDEIFNKKHLKSHLIWYNKIWFFLWPRDSRIYAKPLIQFASLGLIIILSIKLMNFETKEVFVENKTLKSNENLVQIDSNKILEKRPDEKLVMEDSSTFPIEKEVKVSIETKSVEVINKDYNTGWELDELQLDGNLSFSVAVSDELITEQEMKGMNAMALFENPILSDSIINLNMPNSKLTQAENQKILDFITALY